MKKFKILLFITFLAMFNSCRDKMSDCTKQLMDEGYSYEDAKSECEDAKLDGQIIRGGN